MSNKNAISYRRVGDHLIPNLRLQPEEANIRLGKWGMLHKDYLENHNRVSFNLLLTQGKLYQHCAEIENQARYMFDTLIKKLAELETIIKNGKKHIEYIDTIIAHLYEDNVTGKVTDEHYFKLVTRYEAEQAELIQKLEFSEKRLAENKQNKVDLRLLLNTLRECTDIQEFDRTIVNKLIRRIEIHNNDKYDGHCHVKVDIYFTGGND